MYIQAIFQKLQLYQQFVFLVISGSPLQKQSTSQKLRAIVLIVLLQRVLIFNNSSLLIETLMTTMFGKASTPDQSQTELGPRVYFFYYLRLLCCLDQMLLVMVLSQHWVLSSRAIRPLAPCGAQCMGHAITMWSVICSGAAQFDEGVRLHLCVDKWNHPTPVCRQLSLTQAVWGKPNPTGLVIGVKAWSLDVLLQYPCFICNSSTKKCRCLVQQSYLIDYVQLAQKSSRS